MLLSKIVFEEAIEDYIRTKYEIMHDTQNYLYFNNYLEIHWHKVSPKNTIICHARHHVHIMLSLRCTAARTEH